MNTKSTFSQLRNLSALICLTLAGTSIAASDPDELLSFVTLSDDASVVQERAPTLAAKPQVPAGPSVTKPPQARLATSTLTGESRQQPVYPAPQTSKPVQQQAFIAQTVVKPNPQPMPAAAPSAKISQQYWARSTVSAPSAVISGAPSEQMIRGLMARAVIQATQISPRISSSRYQAEAVQGSVDEAKGQRWPQVDVTSSSKSLYFGSGNRPSNEKDDVVSFGVNVATTLYDFGQTSNTIKARQDQAKAATVAIGAESENLAQEVSAALIELQKQRLIIRISEDYVKRMKELADMLKGIVAVDQGRRSELTQARGRLLSAQSAMDAAASKARDTEIVLQRLLGSNEVVMPPASEWNMSIPDAAQLASGVEQHPLVRKALADADAARSEAAAVRSSGLPKLNWVVSKNTGRDELGRRQAFQTGVQVSWGIYRGGSNSAAERAALARAEANLQTVEEQRRDLTQRIRASVQDAQSQIERAALYRDLTNETDRIRLAFFEQWYHLGKRTLLDVLSAESDYYNNRVNEVSSRFDSYASVIRSYASAGVLSKWLSQK